VTSGAGNLMVPGPARVRQSGAMGSTVNRMANPPGTRALLEAG
jgi:hypothetical protein